MVCSTVRIDGTLKRKNPDTLSDAGAFDQRLNTDLVQEVFRE